MTYSYTKKDRGIVEISMVFLSFLLVYLLFFAPVLFTGKLLAPGDGIVQSVPSFYAPRTLWIDTLYGGFPAAADPQMQHWYPVALLFALIPNSWNCFMVSAYVLASCFNYGYVKKVTGSKFAAAFGGLAYGLSGFMVVHLGHTAMVHSAAWIPLTIWSLEELRFKLSWQWFLVGCLAIACLILAGHPQIAVYSFILALAYALFLGWSAPVGRWSYYKIAAAIAILGIALAAIQVIPTAELASLGLRPDMTFEEFNSFSLPPVEALKLIFPYALGTSHPILGLYNTPYFGSWNFVEMSGYVGITTLILALVGLIYFPQRAIAKFWAFTALLCLLLALGDAIPLSWLVYRLPVLNSFRVPARHLLEITFALNILAGMGLTCIIQQLLSQKQFRKIAAYCLGFIALLLIVIFLSKETIVAEITEEAGIEAARQHTLMPWSNLALGIPILIAIAATILLVYLIKFPARHTIRAAVLLLLLLDLSSFGWFCEWRYSPSAEIMQPSAAVQKYSQILDRTHQRLLPIRGVEGHWNEIPVNISRLWGVPSAGGYGPLILSRTSELLSMDVLGKIERPDWSSQQNRSLDLMAVRYVTTPKDLTKIDYRDRHGESYFATARDPNLQDKSRWNRLEDLGRASIYENLRARPRAWLVGELVRLEPEAILKTIRSSTLPDGRSYEPERIALVEAEIDLKSEPLDPRATAKFTQLSQTHLQVKTSSDSTTFLVLSDVYYPGWHAKIDGKAVPIWQTNYVLRGVKVPDGMHTVDFRFESTGFHFAVGVSTAALFACIYVCIFYRFKS